jgi:hypothetical protein
MGYLRRHSALVPASNKFVSALGRKSAHLWRIASAFIAIDPLEIIDEFSSRNKEVSQPASVRH